MPSSKLIPLNDQAKALAETPAGTPTLFLVHPIEGRADCLLPLASYLAFPTFGFQCTADVPVSSIPAMAHEYAALLPATAMMMMGTRPTIGGGGGGGSSGGVGGGSGSGGSGGSGSGGSSSSPVLLGGYSFGACVAFEMCLRMERRGTPPSALILLDGSHAFVASHTGVHKTKFAADDDQAAFAEALCSFALQLLPRETYATLSARFKACSGRDAMLASLVDAVLAQGSNFRSDDVKKAALSFYQKLLAADGYRPDGKVVVTKTLLLKAEDSSVDSATLGPDYGLGSVVDGGLTLETLPGNHAGCVGADGDVAAAGSAAEKLADFVNRCLDGER